MVPPPPPRVLVVDDDEDLREVARMTLEMLGGFEVETASSGDSALSVARERPPDVIVLDARMPGLDGPSTFEALSREMATRDIPVVFLTGAERGSGDALVIDRLPHAGMVSKPFQGSELTEAVQRALRRASQAGNG